jgi:hypothetical protein
MKKVIAIAVAIGLTISVATMAPLLSYGQTSSSSMNSAIESALSQSSFKHPSLISSYAVEPWPTVKEHSTIAISGTLIDALTAKPIPGASIAIKAAFISLTTPSVRPVSIPSQITDSKGNFNATFSAPGELGTFAALTWFNGTKDFYASASLPPRMTIVLH